MVGSQKAAAFQPDARAERQIMLEQGNNKSCIEARQHSLG
jgi:hypothetical protein